MLFIALLISEKSYFYAHFKFQRRAIFMLILNLPLGIVAKIW